MEEEVNYSTVVFKNDAARPKEKEEDPTIYADVKRKEPPSSPPSPEADVQARSHLWLLCLGVLLVLLVGSIIAIIYITLEMESQKVNLGVLTAENQQLMAEKSISEKKTNDLNRTLEFILTFNSFPVAEYCPNKECRPCRKDWILFRGKCYFIDMRRAPYKTWNESRGICRDKATDLLVIDDPQEQEFLSEHIKFYLDKFHGYWFGLEDRDGTWVWIDGREDTHRFWINGSLGDSGSCALMIPERKFRESWDPAMCSMFNRFICEGDALIWSH